jgi:hypothetical protein
VIAVVAALLGAFLGVVGDTAVDRRAATRSACVNFLTSVEEMKVSVVSIMERWAAIDLSELEVAQQQINQLDESGKAHLAKLSEFRRAANEILLVADRGLQAALGTFLDKANEAATLSNAWIEATRTSIEVRLREMIRRRNMGMNAQLTEPAAELPKPPIDKWQAVDAEQLDATVACRQQADSLFLLAIESRVDPRARTTGSP